MKIRRHSASYNFIGDTETGVTFRWGKNLNENPLFAPHPELADISISNHCSKSCSFCYRNSTKNNSFMSLEEYIYILNSLQHPKWGNVFQIAIGGGEPLEHTDFIEIINTTHDRNIVPNFTTNGDLITTSIAKAISSKVGAVAISCQNIKELDASKVEILFKHGIKTNIHFLLNSDTLQQAIEILKGQYNQSLTKINAIIFLTYKPCGRADESKLLYLNDDFLNFVNLIDNSQCSSKIGFDACFVPNLMRYTKVNTNYIDPCECAFFSVYIDEKMNVKPCSFTNNETESFNLKDYKFEEIWDMKFKDIRESRVNNCRSKCKLKVECRGGCPYFDKLNICYS
jgi:radical SAM protein with 4Fe4S-binding SPASM domain